MLQGKLVATDHINSPEFLSYDLHLSTVLADLLATLSLDLVRKKCLEKLQKTMSCIRR